MKLKLIIVLLLIAVQGWAQSNNVQSAANSLKYNEFANAKKFIDLAAENELTANNPKMWYYRAKIYQAIADDSASTANNLDPDAAEKAATSFINLYKTDTKKNYLEDADKIAWTSGYSLFNSAVKAYMKNETERATRLYTLSLDIFPLDKDNNLKRNNITPELVYKNLYFTAYKAKDFPKAKQHLQKLIDLKFNDPKIYLYMCRINLEEKDTASAIASIEKGRAIFDDNSILMNEEIRLYVLTGKTDILIEKLNQSIENAPDNEYLFLTRGTLYDGKKDSEKAAADYKKVLELNPDNLDANYNLGILYFNQGAEKANAANSLKSNEEFEKAKKVFEEKFKTAAPYLEKALEVNTRKTEDNQALYKTTLQILKQLYVRINETEKYNKVKALLEAK